MMKAIGRTILGAALAISFAIAGSAYAESNPSVSNSNAINRLIKGTFSYMSEDGDCGYYPAVGTFTFDGKGNVTGTMDFNDDGTLCPGLTLSGTYVVNADRNTGTASLVMTVPSSLPSSCTAANNDTINFSLSLANGTKTINFVEMDGFTTGTFFDTFDVMVNGVANRR